MKRPDAIAFDLDGTLAESKQRLSAEMGLLQAQLLQKMPVAIMSGASFAQFQMQFFPALPENANLPHLYVFPDNAAQCYVYSQDQWHQQYDHSFSERELTQVMQALEEGLKEVGLDAVPAQTWGERIENRDNAQISFSPLGQQAPVPAKEEWNKQYNEKRKALREALMKRLPECNVSMGGLTTTDITRKGITKAYGIERFAELTHIPISNMLFVGDALEEGGNDSVVIDTGIRTHSVFGPQETAALIETLLSTPAVVPASSSSSAS